MTQPTLSSQDDGPAIDLRVITPGPDVLDPVPRALFFPTEGTVSIDAPDTLSAIPVWPGAMMLVRPRRVTAATGTTVIALY